ncbi:unnamed protein product [Schistocephalus solidus]|uniref:CUB domain-containing protein n=1 Tax=Schistocephalus solidus TaxID=70667 RepID=A0A183T5P8_SCHSO|nr:unnamed protein product [Schistocephalus solidus]
MLCKPAICGGYRKANIGIITSPNYPDKYPDNLECLWTIEAPAQSFIILTFKDFSVSKSLYADCLMLSSGKTRSAKYQQVFLDVADSLFLEVTFSDSPTNDQYGNKEHLIYKSYFPGNHAYNTPDIFGCPRGQRWGVIVDAMIAPRSVTES